MVCLYVRFADAIAEAHEKDLRETAILHPFWITVKYFHFESDLMKLMKMISAESK